MRSGDNKSRGSHSGVGFDYKAQQAKQNRETTRKQEKARSRAGGRREALDTKYMPDPAGPKFTCRVHTNNVRTTGGTIEWRPPAVRRLWPLCRSSPSRSRPAPEPAGQQHEQK